MEETFRRVVAVLRRTGIPWALIGAHAANAFVRPRATVDIDFVVDGPRLKAALAALESEFGKLDVVEAGAAVSIDALALDLVRSDNHALFRAALDLAQDREGVRIPPPELLVVLKLMAAVSPWHNPADRKQDAADLIRLVQTLGSDRDRDAALQHAKRAFPSGDRELARLFDEIDRGDEVSL